MHIRYFDPDLAETTAALAGRSQRGGVMCQDHLHGLDSILPCDGKHEALKHCIII